MNLLGLCGLAGAGKDTAADVLVRDHGYAKVSLADPMKRAVASWFGWDVARLWGPSENRNAPDPAWNGLSARRALQFLGTEIGRELARDVWIRYAIRTARTLLEEPETSYTKTAGVSFETYRRGTLLDIGTHGVAIPDVRFENELAAIHEAGGRVIRIVRSSAGLSGATAAHTSETEQAGISDSAFDGVIYNDGTLDDLARAIGAFVEARAQDGAA